MAGRVNRQTHFSTHPRFQTYRLKCHNITTHAHSRKEHPIGYPVATYLISMVTVYLRTVLFTSQHGGKERLPGSHVYPSPSNDIDISPLTRVLTNFHFFSGRVMGYAAKLRPCNFPVLGFGCGWVSEVGHACMRAAGRGLTGVTLTRTEGAVGEQGNRLVLVALAGMHDGTRDRNSGSGSQSLRWVHGCRLDPR